jgi:hypothetical protein
MPASRALDHSVQRRAWSPDSPTVKVIYGWRDMTFTV